MEKMYQRYAPMVYRRCLRLLGDPEQAKEAMQDVFVMVMRKKDTLDLMAAPSSLLYRMATNICLNQLRHQKRHPEVQDAELILEIAECEGEEEKKVGILFMRSALHSESADMQAMALMHYVDRMTLEELAAEFQLSVSGVRKRLDKFKSRVRSMGGVSDECT